MFRRTFKNLYEGNATGMTIIPPAVVAAFRKSARSASALRWRCSFDTRRRQGNGCCPSDGAAVSTPDGGRGMDAAPQHQMNTYYIKYINSATMSRQEPCAVAGPPPRKFHWMATSNCWLNRRQTLNWRYLNEIPPVPLPLPGL